MLPWVVYRIEDVLKMNSIDSSLVGSWCDDCGGEQEINFLGDGKFERSCQNDDCYYFMSVTNFTFKEILDLKRGDEWYDAVVNFVRDDLHRPLCRIVEGTVFDGHHRIAAAIDLGMKYIVAEQIAKPVIDDDFHEEFVYGY